jgi:hypothetical protein
MNIITIDEIEYEIVHTSKKRDFAANICWKMCEYTPELCHCECHCDDGKEYYLKKVK